MASAYSAPGVVLGLQGAFNVALGAYGILQPEAWRSQLQEQFGGQVAVGIAYGIGLQLAGMGTYACFAASEPSLHRRSLLFRIASHGFAAYLFYTLGGNLKTAAGLDAAFAVMNLATLALTR